MKTFRNIAIMMLGALCLMFGACNNQTVVEPAKDVTNLQYSVNEREVTLTWQLPENENVIAVQIVKENDKSFTEARGAVTSYVIERAEIGVELTYIVRVITETSISKGVSVSFTIEAESVPVPAMLLLAADIEALPDDDEIAAAKWFKATYVDKGAGEFITNAQLQSLSIDDYSVLFIIVDRVGIGLGWGNLPSAITSNEALNGMKKYLADGGNIFLAKHATQLMSAIGRIEEKYAPALFGDGEGGTGDDTWCVNANIGIGTYDHRSHQIFQSMERSSDFYTHEVFPLLGPGGFREDHNCMWDCNAYGFTGDPNVIKNFEDATGSTVLATWGHVVDYCCAGIVEFKPTSEFKGTVIANGMSAFEFKQNNQDNQYQSNVEKLTENTINYLSKLHD